MGGTGGYRPSNKGGGGGGGSHPDPEIRGVVSKKLFCGPFGPQFGLEIMEIRGGGGGGVAGPFPGSAHVRESGFRNLRKF